MKYMLNLCILQLLLLLTKGCGGSGSSNKPIQPPAEMTYVSAQSHVEASGFNSSILIRKGTTEILRQGLISHIHNGKVAGISSIIIIAPVVEGLVKHEFN